ncbi:hypothetical protein B0H15DRAFT_811642 [Mycena belliarum]|uniref:Fork-head domain-containing protein n=1 Tax=Mycena belliarum TaxID=1033014 RepID=A0AAD6XZA1_9AGAR|nr:hypothetical protein B0H15DRAFT_811642 [Mycena belliae]
MSSLKNILNPERKRSVKLLVCPPEQSSSTWEIDESLPSPGSSSEDELDDYNPLEHIPHPDCPDSLACLPDTDGRPQHTLPVILRCAILGSPRKRLTIREIYAAMEEKYAYYRTAGATWKQSVRHHLSLNRLFERQPRPATDPGFGSYWTVNLAAPPGTKRPRKRGRPNKLPKKDDTVEEGSSKPRRGRPRKEDSPLHVVADSTPSIEPSVQVDDDEEVDMLIYEDDPVDELEGHTSEQEDECESEEKLLHPFERRQSLTGLTPYDASGGCHISPDIQPASDAFTFNPSIYYTHESPHLSPDPHKHPHDTEDIIERLQMEMAELRRNSADAITLSMRLTDQLQLAQSDTSKAQTALEATEKQLQDEIDKRRQAERELDEAVRLRLAAEEALRFHQQLPRHAR